MTIRLFEVGGSIRDEVMGSSSPDRDFCAVSPEGWPALVEWCHSNMDKVFLVTHEFFTVRGIIGKSPIDIVMCRKDGPSEDGRHPDFVEPGDLSDDLARRDFTVNALAREVSPLTLEPIGSIIDEWGGLEAAEKGFLFAVGNTVERFEEDGLRLLRAARFAVTKDLKPSPEIAACLADAKWWIFLEETVSQDRIREELTKMFKHNTAATISFLAAHCANAAIVILMGNESGLWLKPTTEKR